MDYEKIPVPEEQIRTRPVCKTKGCNKEAMLHTAYNRRQKFKKRCSSCHKAYLDDLQQKKAEAESYVPGNTLEKFIDKEFREFSPDFSRLKKCFTKRPLVSEKSLDNFL